MAFVVIEGIDGSGKSSVIESLSERMYLHVTREPTDGPVGMLIRDIIYHDKRISMNASVMEHLFNADRLLHMTEIRVEKSIGSHVLCDRYAGSTVAYQTASRIMSGHFADGHNVDIEINDRVIDSMIDTECSSMQGAITPDLCILLDVDTDTAMMRMSNRPDRSVYEKDDGRMLGVVRECYRAWAEITRMDVEIIDATEPLDVVVDLCKYYIDQAIELEKWFKSFPMSDIEKQSIELRRLARRKANVLVYENEISLVRWVKDTMHKIVLKKLGSKEECIDFCRSVGWRFRTGF